MPERSFLDEPDDLPPPPSKSKTPERPEPQKPQLLRGVVVIALLVFAIAAIVGIGYSWLSPPVKPVKPVAKELPSEAPASPRVNPCAHETFDANGCAVFLIEYTVRQTGHKPYEVMQNWCATSLKTPAARQGQVKQIDAAGATRAEAKAIIRELHDYCRTIQPAEGP